MTLTYRVYGPAHGTGSFRTVTRGFLEGLEGLGRKVAFCPTDAFSDEDVEAPGATADVGIWCGWTSGIAQMRRARHRRRFVMVAPNSTVTPPFVFDACKAAEAEVITPSEWAGSVIDAQTGLQPYVVPHGVLAEFGLPLGLERRLPCRGELANGVSVLHVTSTTGERKGTMELIEAWLSIHKHGRYPKNHLTIATDLAGRDHLAARLPPTDQIGVTVDPYAPGSGRAFYRQHDLVVQPSRAEGFGMAPLEALAAGVPIVATAGTGHDQWIDRAGTLGFSVLGVNLGRVIVSQGPLAPIDDYEGSEAPTVRVADIEEALLLALCSIGVLQEQARIEQDKVYARWRWPEAIRPFVTCIENEETEKYQ